MTSALTTEQHGPWRRNTCGHLDAMTKEARAEDTRRWLDQLRGNEGDLRSVDDNRDFNVNADVQFDHDRKDAWQ